MTFLGSHFKRFFNSDQGWLDIEENSRNFQSPNLNMLMPVVLPNKLRMKYVGQLGFDIELIIDNPNQHNSQANAFSNSVISHLLIT